MPPIEEDASSLRQSVDALRTELAEERQRARSRDLARVAVSQLDVDPERALLLALEANSAAITFESRDALQQAVSASRLRWVFGKADEARILHAYFAKDNRHIITAGQDSVLRWWDLEAQEETAALNCCDGVIEGLHLSPLRDRALVTARNSLSGKHRHVVVDLVERKVAASIEEDPWTENHVNTLEVFFSQDGLRLVISKHNGSALSLWDSTSGVRLYEAADVGCCDGIDQEGRRALVTRHDYSVVILHLDDGGRTTLLNLPNEQLTVTSLGDLRAGPMPFSADGSRVTTGTSDRVACVWDARDGRLLHVLGHECSYHRSRASFTPSGRFILVQQSDSVTTEVWDAETGKMQCRLPHGSAFQVPMRILPYPLVRDVEYAVVGMGNSRNSWPLPVNQVSEWKITTGAVHSQLRLPGKQRFQRCFTTDGTSVHLGPRTEQDDISLDANWVLRLEDDVVRVFARVDTEELPEMFSAYGCVYTVDRRIAYTGEGQVLVDSLTNQELAALGTHDRYLFSSDGRHLVATSHAETHPVVHVWDARTGRIRFTINDFTHRITAMQFHPRQDLLLIGSLDRTIRLWSLDSGAEVARATVDAPDEPSYEAASSSDGTKVAFATSGRIHVWHIDRGEIVHAPTMLDARVPRFSADGSWLLAADEDVACVWDTTTMEPIGEFPLHFANVMSGDLSPDKKLAATYGLDSYVRLWEPLGGREVTHWKMPDNYPRRRLRFSADGAFVYCSDGQRLIVDVEKLLGLAKTRVFRELTPDERRLFLGDHHLSCPT
jgi:WD40 repeat protein